MEATIPASKPLDKPATPKDGNQFQKSAGGVQSSARNQACDNRSLTQRTSIYQKRGELAAAVKYLEECIALYPESASAYCVLGKLFRETGQPRQAYEIYQKALDRHVQSPDLLYQHAEVTIGLMDTGSFSPADLPKQMNMAYELIRRYQDVVPPDARTYNLAGLALSYLGRDKEALKEFEMAARLDATNLDYTFNLSFQYQKQAHYQKAITLLKKVLKTKPKSVEAYDRLVWSYLRMLRQDSEAERAVTELVALDANRARSFLLAGNFYEGRGDFGKAHRYYDVVIQLEPVGFQGHFAKGKILDQEGLMEGAAASFLQALKLNPNHTESMVELGKIYLRQDQLGKAEQALVEAVRSDPSYAQAHFQLGTLYRKQGQIENARAELELYEKLRLGRIE